MKSILEYINQYEFEKYLIEELKDHINIEMYINADMIFYEDMSKFKNIKNICDDIINKIILSKYKVNNISIDCKKYNCCFNKIECNVAYSNYNYASLDSVDNNIVTISLNINKDDDYELYNIIIHELTHAYRITNMMNNGIDISKLVTDKYIYGKENFHLDDLSRNPVNKICYLLDTEEIYSYATRLESDIENIIKKNNWTNKDFSKDNFIKELKKNNLWKTYYDLGKFIMLFKSGKLNKFEEERVIKHYNKINNSNLSKKEIGKHFVSQWTKFSNKFNSLISHYIIKSLRKENHNKFESIRYEL